jgi:oxygen-independent coproporphyrinogen-3 oxidase
MKEYLAVFGDPAAAHSAHPDNCTGRERGTGNANVYEKMYLLASEYRVNTAFDNISEAVFTGLRRREGISWREALEVYLRANSAGRTFDETGNAADDKHIRSAEAAADNRTDEECRRSFRNIFADSFREAYEYEQGGLLLIDERGMRLTERGIDISNGIMSLFV